MRHTSYVGGEAWAAVNLEQTDTEWTDMEAWRWQAGTPGVGVLPMGLQTIPYRGQGAGE